jgi:hypothetical protein
MIKTFTHDDIIRFNYQETSKEENTSIENVLLWDEDLNEHHAFVSQIKEMLNSIDLSPSDKTINNIMAYSKSYNNKS